MTAARKSVDDAAVSGAFGARRPTSGAMPAIAKGGFAAILRRRATNETFDESPLPELDSEALDFRVASESFPERGKLGKAEWLTQLSATDASPRPWRRPMLSSNDMPTAAWSSPGFWIAWRAGFASC